MLCPPDGLIRETLTAALAGKWGLTAVSVDYRPVGFGSHHWEVTTGDGGRWFLTVDELETRRHGRDEPLDQAFARLRASLDAVTALREHGCAFAVAPVATRDGEPLARVDGRFAATLHPFVDGESFEWGDFPTDEHRLGTLDMIVSVHTAPHAVRRHAPADDLTVAHRDALEDALRGVPVADCGPYAARAADLLATHRGPVRRMLDRYDELVAESRTLRSRSVLTHGEPHPGNTMRTADGWLLIDWETARVAAPERDLWNLDPGDGSVLRGYADATGVTPEPTMLELYRIQWDLKDLAVDVARFRRPHTGDADDGKSWRILHALVSRAAVPMAAVRDEIDQGKCWWSPGDSNP